MQGKCQFNGSLWTFLQQDMSSFLSTKLHFQRKNTFIISCFIHQELYNCQSRLLVNMRFPELSTWGVQQRGKEWLVLSLIGWGLDHHHEFCALGKLFGLYFSLSPLLSLPAHSLSLTYKMYVNADILTLRDCYRGCWDLRVGTTVLCRLFWIR